MSTYHWPPIVDQMFYRHKIRSRGAAECGAAETKICSTTG
jgi:hypothetical protein